MEKLEWLKALVQAEQELEESGMFDTSAGFDAKKILEAETIDFLTDLKMALTEAATTFNELKSSPLGTVKIYGIAKTQADFMLFRNGYKLVFSMLQPGKIAVRFNFVSASYITKPMSENEPSKMGMMEDNLEAQAGIFGDVQWIYQGQPIRIDSAVRYYFSRFLQDSIK